MPKLTFGQLTLFVLAEMSVPGMDLDELCENGDIVEQALRAFARISHGTRDPELYLINSFHDLATKEADRVKRRPDHRSRPARDPSKGRSP